jgi:kinesin family member 5
MSKSVGSAVKKKSAADPTTDSIRVICRVRPQNERERGTDNAVECDEESGNMRVKNSYSETQNFSFDAVLGPLGTQEKLYEISASVIVHDVTMGFNGTVFAYGQTSSGKTHTMQGPHLSDPALKGVIPRALDHVFQYISRSAEDMEFVVKVSLIEIYMERIRDLFDPSKTDLKIREDKSKGIWIENVSEICVGSPQESMDLLRFGQSNRSTAATLMNAESSRSHSIFIVSLFQKSASDTKESKLYLVDLAGSEKVRKTGAEGQVLEEAKMINKSLSALGNVINALTDPKTGHIPYRDSKLTRILQESLGGNSKTCLIINCSPSLANEDETLSTLRFGQRAKFITNKAQVNMERSPAELQAALSAAEKELETLKEQLRVKSPVSPSDTGAVDAATSHAEQMIAQLRVEKQELEVDMEALVHELDLCVQESASRDSRLDELSGQLQQAQLLLQNVNFMSAENDRLQDEIIELNNKLRAAVASDNSKSERIAQLVEENRKTREMLDASLASSQPPAPVASVLSQSSVTAASRPSSSPNPFLESPASPVAGLTRVSACFSAICIFHAVAAAESKQEDAALLATNISVDSHNTTVEEGSRYLALHGVIARMSHSLCRHPPCPSRILTFFKICNCNVTCYSRCE